MEVSFCLILPLNSVSFLWSCSPAEDALVLRPCRLDYCKRTLVYRPCQRVVHKDVVCRDVYLELDCSCAACRNERRLDVFVRVAERALRVHIVEYFPDYME